jgi:hypothetical protein
MGARFSRLLLVLGCLTLGGCCLSPAGEDPLDAGTVVDGGPDAGVDAGTHKPIICTNQIECGCTCVCSSGASGVTYASCIFGFCEDCTPYCYDWCL